MGQLKRRAIIVLAGLCIAANAWAWNIHRITYKRGGGMQSYPNAVEIADFDNDGRNDVLLATRFSNTSAAGQSVWFYRQLPDGSLAPPTELLHERYPTAIRAADINGDGRTDLVTINTFELVLLVSRPDGGYEEQARQVATGWLRNLELYDADRDGVRDIVLLEQQATGHVFRLDNGGNIVASVVFSVPVEGYNDVAVGDVDHDGFDDLVVSTGQGLGEQLMVLGPDGNGSLAVRRSWQFTDHPHVSSVAVGDLDGDGLEEIAFSLFQNAPTEVYRILLDTQLDLVQSDWLEGYDLPNALVAADFNGDGGDDLIAIHDGWNALTYYMQRGGDLVETVHTWLYANIGFGRPELTAVGDVTGDGCPDVVVADYSGLVDLQVMRGVQCGLSPLPTVDFGPRLGGQYHLNPDGPSTTPHYVNRVLANIRTKYAGEFPVYDGVMHLTLSALPPFQLALESVSVNWWGSCTVDSTTAASAEITCRSKVPIGTNTYFAAFDDVAFWVDLDATVATRVLVQASVGSGSQSNGEVFAYQPRNQYRRTVLDFTQPTLHSRIEALRQRVKP